MAKKLPYNQLEQRVKELEDKTLHLKHVERVARESQEKWHSLAATVPFLILILDSAGTVHFLNRALGAYTPENMVGKSFWKYVPHDYRNLMHKSITDVFQGGNCMSFEIFWAGSGGTESAWYMAHLGPVLNVGKVVAATIVLIDITERKKERKALEDSETQKNAILDASVDRIRLSDTDMRIIWANHAHERDLNIRPEDIIGKHCYTVFVKRGNPCPECPSIQAFTSGKIEHAILTRFSSESSKEKVYLDAYAVPLKDKAGKILSCIQITRDITKRVDAEKALQAREKQLKRKAINLKRANIALHVLLKQREDDKRELEEKMLLNVEHLLGPCLEKLEKTGLNDEQKACLKILKKNLNNITSPFLRTLCSTHLNISPTEMQVASHIKEGKTTKEIAESMNLSIRGIEFHRNNLREKLGLKHKKVNIRSYLLSLP